MILIVVKDGKQLARFAASKHPEVGTKIRIGTDVFTVNDVIYEFYGRNDEHSVEIQVS